MKNILIFGDAVSSKNGGSASFCELCIALQKKYSVLVSTNFGKFDRVLYKHKQYFKMKQFLTTTSMNIIDRRYLHVSFAKLVLNKFSSLIFGNVKFNNIDYVIDCVGLKKDVIKKLKSNGVKVFRMHNGSAESFMQFFGNAPKYSFEENLNFYKKSMQEYTGILFQSEEQLIEAKKIIGSSKYFFVPPSCDEVAINRILSLKNVKDKYNYNLVQVASIQPRKNQIKSVELVSALRSKGMRINLQLIGSIQDKEYYKQLLNVIQKNNAESYISILGFKPNYLNYIVNANALIIPSEAEGVSRSLREAFYAKTLVLARPISGMKLFIKHEQIIDFENIDLDKIHDMLQDEDKINIISNNARKFYDDNYSWSKYADRVSKIFSN